MSPVSSASPDSAREFRALLRSAGVLGFGRQAGALVFMGAVVVLPRLASRPAVDDFVWAYFAALFLTSILNLGLERVVAPLVAQGQGKSLVTTVRPVLVARICSIPITLASLWVLYRVVGVALPIGAWALSLLWIVAIQVQGVAFAGLRAGGRPGIEPRLAVTSRILEALAVVGLASVGRDVTALIGAVALVETAVAVLAVQALGRGPRAPVSSLLALPWRSIGLYTGIEVLAFAYLRVDMVLVGHLLGSGPGATYGLIYRVVDALTSFATPVLLLLFPYAARLVWQKKNLSFVRDRALRLLPAGALVASLAALFAAALLAALVPRFGEGLTALRLLIVAVPLYFVSAIELHLRSAEDRNREVVVIGTAVLVLNIVLNLVLVPRLGLVGAATALLVTEVVQLVVLLLPTRASDPSLIRAGTTMLAYAAGLASVAVLLNVGQPLAAAAAGTALTAAVVRVSLWPDVRELAGGA